VRKVMTVRRDAEQPSKTVTFVETVRRVVADGRASKLQLQQQQV
jgi:hypothetical protein